MSRYLEEGLKQHKPSSFGILILKAFFLILCSCLFLLVSLTLMLSAISQFASNSSQVLFYQISDLHLNPFYNGNFNSTNGCSSPSNIDEQTNRMQLNQTTKYPFGQFGCDGPEILINSTLKAMLEINPNINFLLVTGDFVGHSMPSQQIYENVLIRTTQIIADFYPNTPVWPVIGNNDVWPHYHFVVNQTNNVFLNDLAELWDIWLNTTQLETLRQGGFYSADVAAGVRLIVLNTVMYSSELVNSMNSSISQPTPPDQLPLDPNSQFEWLQHQLEETLNLGELAIIAYHIPPGTNSYDVIPLWHAKYVIQYDSIVAKYKEAILMQLCGHFHSDEFRLIWGKDKQKTPVGSVLLSPSISPIYTNNPSFRLFSLANQNLQNFVQYFADLPRANAKNYLNFTIEYDFQRIYGESNVSTNSLWSLFGKLKESTALFMQYLNFIKVYYAPQRAGLLCATSDQANANFEKCIEQYGDDDGAL